MKVNGISLSPPPTSDSTATPGIRLDLILQVEKYLFMEEIMTVPGPLSLREVLPGSWNTSKLNLDSKTKKSKKQVVVQP